MHSRLAAPLLLMQLLSAQAPRSQRDHLAKVAEMEAWALRKQQRTEVRPSTTYRPRSRPPDSHISTITCDQPDRASESGVAESYRDSMGRDSWSSAGGWPRRKSRRSWPSWRRGIASRCGTGTSAGWCVSETRPARLSSHAKKILCSAISSVWMTAAHSNGSRGLQVDRLHNPDAMPSRRRQQAAGHRARSAGRQRAQSPGSNTPRSNTPRAGAARRTQSTPRGRRRGVAAEVRASTAHMFVWFRAASAAILR